MRQKYVLHIDPIEIDFMTDTAQKEAVIDVMEKELTGEPLRTIRVYPDSQELERFIDILKNILVTFSVGPFHIVQYGHKNRTESPDTSLYTGPYENLSFQEAQAYAAGYSQHTIYFVAIRDANRKVVAHYKDGKPL